VNVNNGLSGAVVVENNKATVTKQGGIVEKTIEQGRWIMENSTPAFPLVFELTSDGYVMERLDHMSPTEVRAVDVVSLLRRYVWGSPATQPATQETRKLLRNKVTRNLESSGLHLSTAYVDAALTAAERAYEAALSAQPALSHGDATAENVMYRRGFGPVLIDPIPATLAVPDSPCVDVGKMLQSAYGWEEAKYMREWRAYSTKDVEHAVADSDLFVAGQAWAVVHVIRAIPYVKRQAPASLGAVSTVLSKALEAGGFYK
jgi:hypothetical protein